MDKKLVISLATGAIAALGSVQAQAAFTEIANSSTPSEQTITAAGYAQSNVLFRPSANVKIGYDLLATTVAAGDTAIVSAANQKQGSRSFSGAVGATSLPPKACENTGSQPVTTLKNALADVRNCTY